MLVSISSMPAKENILEYVRQIEQYADFLHCDVCDGQYNDSKCFSKEMANMVNENSTLPIDVHLMTENQIETANDYIKSGANIITCQIESFKTDKSVFEFIKTVQNRRCLVGLSLEPATNVKCILPYLTQIDVVLVMSVKTGKSGQIFDNSILDKIEYLSKLRNGTTHKYLIEVDGGINTDVAKILKHSGADILVSGNFAFKSSDKKMAIDLLR